MPHITTYGYSNPDTVREPALYDQQGKERISGGFKSRPSAAMVGGPIEPVAPVKAPGFILRPSAEEGEMTSAGTSSSASESKPDKSGPSGTPDPQSPAPDAESPSKQDLPPSQAPSSTAPSTSGSTPVTGQGQLNLPASSAGSPPAKEATADPSSDATAHEKMAEARTAYESGEFDKADSLVSEAERMDDSLKAEVAAARSAIAAGREAAARK